MIQTKYDVAQLEIISNYAPGLRKDSASQVQRIFFALRC
jgi:hypothetical protein